MWTGTAAVSSRRTADVRPADRTASSGDLKEKTLAAHRGGIKTFILPKRNAKELAELPEIVRTELGLVQVSSLDEVLAVAVLPARRREPDRDVGRPQSTVGVTNAVGRASFRRIHTPARTGKTRREPSPCGSVIEPTRLHIRNLRPCSIPIVRS